MNAVVIFLVIIIAILLAIMIRHTPTNVSSDKSSKNKLIVEKEKLIDKLRIEKNFIGGAVYFGFNEKNNHEEQLIDSQIYQIKREIELLKL